jgi:hypothetical protein
MNENNTDVAFLDSDDDSSVMLTMLGKYDKTEVMKWFDLLHGEYGNAINMHLDMEMDRLWDEIQEQLQSDNPDEDRQVDLFIWSTEVDLLMVLYTLPDINSIDFVHGDVAEHFDILIDEAWDWASESYRQRIEDNKNWYGDTEEDAEMILAEIARQRDLQKLNQANEMEVAASI